jgi:hypothetical protein
MGQNRIDRFVQHVDSPGEEIAWFVNLKKAVKDKSAIVSMDYIGLRNLESRQHRIIQDFAKDFVKFIAHFQDYPMTSLVVPHSAWQAYPKQIRRMKCAVGLALRMCKDSPDEALALLRRHYEQRQNAESPMSGFGLKPLTRLRPDATWRVEEMFTNLLDCGHFPEELHFEDTRRHVDTAWEVYKKVNQDSLTAPFRDLDYTTKDVRMYAVPLQDTALSKRSALTTSRKDSDNGGTTTQHLLKQIDQLSGQSQSLTEQVTFLQEQNALLFQTLCTALESALLSYERQEHLVTEVISWIDALPDDTIDRKTYKVLPFADCNYVCENEHTRKALKREFDRLLHTVTGGRSFGMDIIGNSGSGKSTFADDLIARLHKCHFVSMTLDVRSERTVTDFEDKLRTELKKMGRRMTRGRYGVVFVDEVNQPKGLYNEAYVFPVLFQFLQPTPDLVTRWNRMKVDLNKIAWLFAGTHGSTKDEAKNFFTGLRDQKGPDFYRRLDSHAELPSGSDILQRLIMVTTIIKRILPNVSKVSVPVLLYLSLPTYESAKEMKNAIKDNLNMKAGRTTVGINDISYSAEFARFRSVYASEVDRLEDRLILVS